MTDSVLSLTALRREIDRIDKAMHDLLMRRTEAVLAIAAAKRRSGDPVLRPAREAEVLRGLVARHQGPFPKSAMVRLWREIMAGSVHVQAPISLAVFAPQGQGTLLRAAHDHFGTSTPARRHDRAQSVLAEVSEGRATVGILPLPAEEDPDPWWPALVGVERTTPRIMARLPFVPGGSPALAVALFEQEPSGADHSYLILETPGPMSRHAMTEALTAAALTPVFLAATREFYLAEISDFVGRYDARLSRLASAGRAIVVGGYAVPFTAAEIGS